MTVEAGTITGELELVTRPTRNGAGVQALVRYRDARDLYTIVGGPVSPAYQGLGEQVDHQKTHERIVRLLTTRGDVASGNERAVDLHQGA